MKLLMLLCVFVALFGVIFAESPQCLQPVDSGLCYGHKPRYAYTREKGCHEFVYGGCGGNDNNFETYADCQRACLVPR